MSKKIPAPLKNVYRQYYASKKVLYASHVLLALALAVIAPFEFAAGIRMLNELGARIFDTLYEPHDPVIYIVTFVLLVIVERILKTVYKKVRIKQLSESLSYMQMRFDAMPGDDPVVERASASKNAFGDILDIKLEYINSVLLIVSLAAVTCYTNFIVGIPLVIIEFIYFDRVIKQKPVGKLLRLADNLLLQLYFLSTLLMIILRFSVGPLYSYGSLLGYYAAILLRMLLQKDLPQDGTNFKLNLTRLPVLAEAFALYGAENGSKKLKKSDQTVTPY